MSARVCWVGSGRRQRPAPDPLASGPQDSELSVLFLATSLYLPPLQWGAGPTWRKICLHPDWGAASAGATSHCGLEDGCRRRKMRGRRPEGGLESGASLGLGPETGEGTHLGLTQEPCPLSSEAGSQ